MLTELIATHPKILAECAIAERMRRMPGITLHPTLFNTPLIYGPDDARDAMSSTRPHAESHHFLTHRHYTCP